MNKILHTPTFYSLLSISSSMQSKATTVDQYISECPDDRQPHLKKLRKTILDNLPKGFEECMNYGMVGYVVPHSIYPDGYHCDPSLPLPFAGFASQKQSINFYHSLIYADDQLKAWFVSKYSKIAKHKIDMGKSCIRFKYFDEIPYDTIASLMQKITAAEWIQKYESLYTKR